MLPDCATISPLGSERIRAKVLAFLWERALARGLRVNFENQTQTQTVVVNPAAVVLELPPAGWNVVLVALTKLADESIELRDTALAQLDRRNAEMAAQAESHRGRCEGMNHTIASQLEVLNSSQAEILRLREELKLMEEKAGQAQFASAAAWDEVDRIKKLRRKRGLESRV